MNRGQLDGKGWWLFVGLVMVVVTSAVVAFTPVTFGTPHDLEMAEENTVTPNDRGAWELLKLSVIAIVLAVLVSLLISVPKRWPGGNHE